MKRRITSSIVAAALLLGSINPSHAQTFNPCTATPSDTTPAVSAELYEDGFEQPVFVTHANDGSGRLFVVEQPGLIRIVRNSFTFLQSFLDIRERVAFGGERGLLSMAFHPDYANNGRFFVNYTARGDGRTVIAEYRVSDNPDVALPQERVILTIDQPFANHNGGQIQFGPDGFLYIGMGDGGSGGDPRGNGQNLSTLTGSLLRIDVDSDDPYAVPDDNPFLSTPAARPEIYAYGLRNPWRFSFDRCDGRLFLVDVGQNRVEEVNLIVSGGNYGWNTMEGSECFQAAACIQGGLELPITEYFHGNQGGRSITGGYVYRGTQFQDLAGRYFFADFVSSRVWSLVETAPGSWTRQELFVAPFNVSSFGEDEAGEVYLTGFDGGVYRLVQVETSSVSSLGHALDVNGNQLLDDAEIMEAVRLWATGEPVPGLGIQIDDGAMTSLIAQWARGTQILVA